MKTLMTLVTGSVLGLILGLWFGVNIGKEKPLFSNPFADKPIQQVIQQKVGEGVEKVGQDVEALGKEIKTQ